MLVIPNEFVLLVTVSCHFCRADPGQLSPRLALFVFFFDDKLPECIKYLP
jgi:hypothetical protein